MIWPIPTLVTLKAVRLEIWLTIAATPAVVACASVIVMAVMPPVSVMPLIEPLAASSSDDPPLVRSLVMLPALPVMARLVPVTPRPRTVAIWPRLDAGHVEGGEIGDLVHRGGNAGRDRRTFGQSDRGHRRSGRCW